MDYLFRESLFKEVRFEFRPEQEKGSHGKGRGHRT